MNDIFKLRNTDGLTREKYNFKSGNSKTQLKPLLEQEA